jgi:hypothetical protein
MDGPPLLALKLQGSLAMTPSVRKFNLTAHVVSSLAWMGAVAAFLALSIAGLVSRDPDIVRGAYLSMNLIGLFVIVPLSFTALVTGFVQSMGTEWGLVRHYWILLKLALTIGSTLLLLLHQFTAVASAARSVLGAAAGTLPDAGPAGMQLAWDAGLAVLVLLLITTLSVYKPWGLTSYGRRRLPQRPDVETPFGLKVFLAAVGVIVLVGFVVSHHGSHGLGSHGH